MEFVEVRDVLSGKLEGQQVRLRGWVHHKRSSGGVQFILLRDGTGIVQCTVKKDLVPPEVFETVKRVPIESTVELSGVVVRDERAPGGYEVSLRDFRVVFEAERGYPIAKKYHGPDFLLEKRHLWIRSEKMQRVLRIRARLLKAARDWLESQGFVEAHAPTFVSAACEGGATLFEVKYFDTKAYLTQSWQLYAEAMIASLGKIYTIAPSFRAEKSRTRRHLTEFWHLEVEIPWCDLECMMKVAEGLVCHICQTLADEMGDDLEKLGRDPDDLRRVKPPLPRITYDEAIELLKKDGVEVEWGEDLDWSYEKPLTFKFDVPFFITHYPKTAKAFYHKPDPNRPEVTLSADMLAPEGYGEIIGGGERIERLDVLLERLREEGLDPKDYDWYIDLRRYGSVPHAGFGLGVERTVAWICKLSHVRDAIAFPRLLRRPYP